MQDDRPGVHWSTDAVEHIRTVHFALIAACLALIVLATSGTPAEISRARQQIQDIAEVTKDELWDQDFVEKSAQNLIDEKHREGRYPSSMVSKFAEPEEFRPTTLRSSFELSYVEFTSPNWAVAGAVSEKYTVKNNFLGLFNPREIIINRPTTLEQFRDLWDALGQQNSVAVPTGLSKRLYHFAFEDLYRDAVIESTNGEWKTAASVSSRTLHADFGLIPDVLRRRIPSLRNEYGYFIREDLRLAPSTYGFFPVQEYSSYPFDAQNELIKRFPKDRQPVHGSFEYSFRALNAFTKNYQSLEITKFDAILESEQSRTGESFEAFGVKFPAQGTTRWGILVVLGIQLYFLIHLRELSGRLRTGDPGWDVAWIGVYDSALSKMVFVVSAFVLPVCAVTALGIRGLYVSDFGKLYWSMLCGGTLAALALALTSWRYSLKMREQPAFPSTGTAKVQKRHETSSA